MTRSKSAFVHECFATASLVVMLVPGAEVPHARPASPRRSTLESQSEQAKGSAVRPRARVPDAVREACDRLESIARPMKGVRVVRTAGAFADEQEGITRTGCSISVAGSWRRLGDRQDPFEAWRSALMKRGWREDVAHAADGPDGTAFAYRTGRVICLVQAEWDGGDDEQPDAPRDDAFKGRASCAQISAGSHSDR